MGKPLDTSFEQSNSLTVRDNRTGKLYTIPCVRSYRRGFETYPFPTSIQDNSIQATAFKDVKAPPSQNDREENETDKGLRIADKGYLNTAVIRSEITYINGDAGGTSWLFICLNYHVDMSPVLRYRCRTLLF
jgi:citrate synthase